MDVAVAGVHVQSHENASLQNALMHGVALGKDRRERRPTENLREPGAQLRFPAHADTAVLKPLEQRSRGVLSD